MQHTGAQEPLRSDVVSPDRPGANLQPDRRNSQKRQLLGVLKFLQFPNNQHGAGAPGRETTGLLKLSKGKFFTGKTGYSQQGRTPLNGEWFPWGKGCPAHFPCYTVRELLGGEAGGSAEVSTSSQNPWALPQDRHILRV